MTLTSISRSESMIAPARNDDGIEIVDEVFDAADLEFHSGGTNYTKKLPESSTPNAQSSEAPASTGPSSLDPSSNGPMTESSEEIFHSLSSDAEHEAGGKRNAARDSLLSSQPEAIRWKPNLSNLFNDLKALPIGEARLLETGKTKFCNLPVIRIGLRYIPEGDDPDLRTVTVTNLLPSTTLGEILRSVRGGQVLTATICNTAAITGSQTALITFTTSAGAAGFLNIVQSDGFFVGFHKAQVRLVKLPTFPMRRILQDRIVNRGRTRALTVFNANGNVKKIIFEALSSSLVTDFVEGFKDHPCQSEVTVLFYSIEMAMRAFKILHECPRITKVWFGSDPCARQYTYDAGK